MPKGVYTRTEKHRKIISNSTKGIKKPILSIKLKGKHNSFNTEFKKGHKTIFTDKMKEKISKSRLGKKLSPETRAKMSLSKKGKPAWNKGKRFPEWSGANRYNWKGGKNYWNIRRNRIINNGGNHTQEEWEILKAQYNWTCPSCNKTLELVKDHIIPLAKGGSHNIENIQPLCRSCNAKKHINIIKYEKTKFKD